MRRLYSLVRSAAPFLFAERGSLALTRAIRGAGTGGRQDPELRAFSDAREQRGLLIRGEHADLALSGVLVSDCDASGASLLGINLDQGQISRSHFRRGTLRGVQASRSSWEVIDLEGALLTSWEAPESHLALVSFRDAQLEACKLDGAVLTLCDFSGADLKGVSFRGARLIGCDFEGAILDDVDFGGADMGHSSLRRIWCGTTSWEGAQIDGTDLRGAAGLNSSARKALADRGARTSRSWLYDLWARLLPGAAANSHRRVLRAVSITWAIVALAVPILFFARAIIAPIDPEDPPGFEHHQGPEPN